MFRYFAILWTITTPERPPAVSVLIKRLHESGCWTLALSVRGLLVYCSGLPPSGTELCRLADDSGLIVGNVFRRGDPDEDPSKLRVQHLLSGLETHRIIKSKGQDLLTSYWGRYVAFLFDRDSGRHFVMRDPTGRLPCYYSAVDGTTVLFSYANDLRRVARKPLTVDWSFILGRLTFGPYQAHTTGLLEVAQVHGGECVEFDNTVPNRLLYWDPLRFVHEDPVENPKLAQLELTKTVRHCASSWASVYTRVIHRLSGGLDSSVVLACLARALPPSAITCLTEYSSNGRSDERRWARLAAGSEGCALVERPLDISVDLRRVLSIDHTVTPTSDLQYLVSGPTELELASERKASVISDGNGGDSLFGSHSAPFAAADYARTYGLNAHLARVALEVAMLRDRSIYATVWNAILDGKLRRDSQYIRDLVAIRKLVHPHAKAAALQAERYPHPWFVNLRGVPRGRLYPLMLVAWPARFYDPLTGPNGSVPERVSPLLSQPVVELSLRIPSHFHVQNGINRSLARKGFSTIVPAEIIRRQWKDRSPGYRSAVLRSNIGFVREVLLDGHLVSQRILDRRSVEEALSNSITQSAALAIEIFDCVIVEAWLCNWLSADFRTAA